jgi:hypothetical protein
LAIHASHFLIFFVLKKIKKFSENIEISIPFEITEKVISERSLVYKYETNQLIRAIDTWIVLKHLSTPSLIQNWNKQKDYLLTWCKCSETIFRHRLKILSALKLLSFDRNKIELKSWQTLANYFNCSIKNKFVIQYNQNDNQKIHLWIAAAEIQLNKNRQDEAILRKMNKNPETFSIIFSAMLRAGADRNSLNNSSYFLNWLRILYRNDFQNGASDIHQILIDIRPDNNRTVKSIAKAMGSKHAMTAVYWKKIMQKAKIIDVSKLSIVSKERVRNNKCHVIWLDTPNIRKNYPERCKKQTMLCLCDQIEILQRSNQEYQKMFEIA